MHRTIPYKKCVNQHDERQLHRINVNMAAPQEGVVLPVAAEVANSGAAMQAGNTVPSCAYYLVRKKRCCKLAPANGMKFCMEHVHLGSEKELYETKLSRKRIPCPFNPKHSCFQDELERHLQRCNEREKILGPYHVKDINAGSEDEESPVISFRLIDASEDEILTTARKILDVFREQRLNIKEEFLVHDLMKTDLQNPELGRTLKHLQQEASLLGHMDREGLLAPDSAGRGTCYVEFGAGRARLASDVIRAVNFSISSSSESLTRPSNSIILVERWRTRNKRENRHRDSEETSVERVRLDIKDLALGQHPTVARCTSVVAFGKHVCGSATDLSLRCLITTMNVHERDRGEPAPKAQCLNGASPPASTKLRGILIALCCHHRCTWRAYVGKRFWLSCGLTSRQFQIASCLSCWATCAFERNIGKRDAGTAPTPYSDDDDSDAEHCPDTADKMDLTVTEKEEIGRACKRVIDIGRMAYLAESGFTSRLAYYVSPSTSLENVVLITKPGGVLQSSSNSATHVKTADDAK